MGILKEFKEFAIRGNVVDLAVAVIIGGAFGKIVTSFVEDIVMPALGAITGGVSFTDLKCVISKATPEAAEVAIYYGKFIQSIFDFAIVAFAIFMAVKGINSMKKAEAEAPAALTADQTLLTEIRDLLSKK
ncbi:MAG: large conductance mechanosensitive channel protein MscL [Flavobacteriaceae bacterium]|nr:MAG: large conductance mechanosensitive channel protein MscL [Flavobacteriaceae bacterium]